MYSNNTQTDAKGTSRYNQKKVLLKIYFSYEVPYFQTEIFSLVKQRITVASSLCNLF